MDRLTYTNSWESDIYKVKGKVVRKLKEVLINGRFYKVTNRTVAVPYSDMGQPGQGISTHYFVKEEVFGVKMEFDLNKIVGRKGATVYAAEYVLEGEK